MTAASVDRSDELRVQLLTARVERTRDLAVALEAELDRVLDAVRAHRDTFSGAPHIVANQRLWETVGLE